MSTRNLFEPIVVARIDFSPASSRPPSAIVSWAGTTPMIVASPPRPSDCTHCSATVAFPIASKE